MARSTWKANPLTVCAYVYRELKRKFPELSLCDEGIWKIDKLMGQIYPTWPAKNGLRGRNSSTIDLTGDPDVCNDSNEAAESTTTLGTATVDSTLVAAQKCKKPEVLSRQLDRSSKRRKGLHQIDL
ncbi:hypothetical protein OE88DRAFT_1738631 [Heliocybe sulcata]|uniref:Uncharacterized protein n=1 Tax=Heliocybe sulcata TaxID=5364 RepID=A0A5C3MPK7_9AGAM|nr:hypothetical protein OE88DRAFT_1738631 [Heliocybe sulcata]